MRKSLYSSLFVLLGSFTAYGGAAAETQEIFVSGTQPAQRPANAPVVREAVKDEAWRARALGGVLAPYPPSVLGFLEHQGNWYTPFTRPGMSGPYDLRGWHRR